MKPSTSARSAERRSSTSSRTSRRRPPRNRHNLLPMKKNNQPGEVVGLKVPPEGQAGHLGGLADQADLLGGLADQADLLVGLRVLPVGRADHLEGAEEDDGPRKG
jgi:hypothetical protein